MYKRFKFGTNRISSNFGFTIVELMIALSILSTILVIGSVITIQIGGLYTKGINSANLQNATRRVVTDITSTLQYSGTVPMPCTPNALTCYASTNNQSINGQNSDVYSYCVDGTRYTFLLDRKLGKDESNGLVTPHVLWHDKIKTNVCAVLDMTMANPTDVNSDGDGFEMMPENARLNKFKIVESPVNSGLYMIDLWTAHGDTDLINVDSNGVARCVGTVGTQFCAISQLSDSALRRVQ